MKKTVKPALIIMAAGMGSRFGGDGQKQVAAVGPSGERIIDYSAYDAINAGFEHIIFVIKRDMYDMFKHEIGDNVQKHARVSYVFQETDQLPSAFSAPDRVKPWGTGQAVLCCKDSLEGAPFAVINADDFYGDESFSLLYNFLTENSPDSIAIVCYNLGKTMSENGTVSRGVCTIENGDLKKIEEHTQIKWLNSEPHFTTDDQTWTYIGKETPVSMNCFAFAGDMIAEFEKQFTAFLLHNIDDEKAEFFIPKVVDTAIDKHGKNAKCFLSTKTWHGITYPNDVENVIFSISKLVKDGKYPLRLWK